ncbi:MAG: hydrogenase maturation protease [Acidobacteriota bacterium]
MPQALVLGVGNVLMGDEGVGVHVARRLAEGTLPAGVSALDGGTGGFHLLSLFADYDPLVIVDATLDGQPAGTVRVTEPRYPSDFPPTLAVHDIGLRDLVESAALVGRRPRIWLVAVSIERLQPMTIMLSPSVAAAVADVAALAVALAARGLRTAAGPPLAAVPG